MSDNDKDDDPPNERFPCSVCNVTLSTTIGVKRHMLRWHPIEWANQGHEQPIRYHPCTVPGCTQLDNNTRPDRRHDHLSMFHGIDIPSKMRTLNFCYLRRKRDEILKQHILLEATELNELNKKIRHLECLLNLGAAPGVSYYKSCHRFDVDTFFATDLFGLPGKKTDFISYLQHIRTVRSQVGSLYTKPGVMDTRDGVLDELETVMGWL